MEPYSAELAAERAHLVQADRDIEDGEERVRHQRDLRDDLLARGIDHARAESLLALLEETLTQWRMHRGLIAERIRYLEGRRRDALALRGLAP